jgi:dolichol-phosphate mannosyltransferase
MTNRVDAHADLPAYTAHLFAPRRSRFCLLVTVIDESQRLRRQLAHTQAYGSLVDVIVSDGGSSDGSTDPGALRRLGVRAVLVSRREARFSASLRIGFAWALEQGYEGVITVDGNDKDGVEALPAFVDALDAGWDFVQGSRFAPGGRHQHTPLLRYMGIRYLHAPIVRHLSGFAYTDTTNGFRAHSATLLLDHRLQLSRAVFSGYELPAYLAIRAPQLGFRVRELPVSRCYPSGPVPTKIRPVRGPLELLWVLWRVRHGHLDAPGAVGPFRAQVAEAPQA